MVSKLKLVCSECGHKGIYTRKKDGMRRCTTCGHEWNKESEGKAAKK